MRSLRLRTVLAGLASVALAAAVLAGTATPPSLASSAPNIWAWGNGPTGELGDGSYDHWDFPVRTAQALAGAEVTQLVAGGGTSAALLSKGTVWTWGDNFWGELGNGSTGDSRTTPGQVPGLSGITQIAISYNGTHMFALGPGCVVWGWGLNDFGQLGNGTTRQPRVLPHCRRAHRRRVDLLGHDHPARPAQLTTQRGAAPRGRCRAS